MTLFEDVFKAVCDAISQEALAEAGDLGITKRRKKRRKVQTTDATTGQTTTEEVETDDDAPEALAAPRRWPRSRRPKARPGQVGAGG